MKKLSRIFIMATVLCALGSHTMVDTVSADEVEFSSVATQEKIEPFGGIKWNDSLLQLIVKLSAITGIQHVRLHLGGVESDVRTVAKREDLEKILSDLMLKYNPRIFKDLKPMTENYTGKSGTKRKYMHLTPKITASPIIISSVAFELTATFDNAPGLEVVNVDAVPVEKRGGHSFPLVVSEITLASKAPGLKDRFQKITEIIETKYRKFDPEADRLFAKPDSGIEGTVADKDGNMLSVSMSPNEASLIYTGEKYRTQLGEAYRKHLAVADRKTNAGKADLESGL